jgi:hypothetical protein
MLGRSEVITLTKRDTVAFQVWGWVWGCEPHSVKKRSVGKLLKLEVANVHLGL